MYWILCLLIKLCTDLNNNNSNNKNKLNQHKHVSVGQDPSAIKQIKSTVATDLIIYIRQKEANDEHITYINGVYFIKAHKNKLLNIQVLWKSCYMI